MIKANTLLLFIFICSFTFINCNDRMDTHEIETESIEILDSWETETLEYSGNYHESNNNNNEEKMTINDAAPATNGGVPSTSEAYFLSTFPAGIVLVAFTKFLLSQENERNKCSKNPSSIQSSSRTLTNSESVESSSESFESPYYSTQDAFNNTVHSDKSNEIVDSLEVASHSEEDKESFKSAQQQYDPLAQALKEDQQDATISQHETNVIDNTNLSAALDESLADAVEVSILETCLASHPEIKDEEANDPSLATDSVLNLDLAKGIDLNTTPVPGQETDIKVSPTDTHPILDEVNPAIIPEAKLTESREPGPAVTIEFFPITKFFINKLSDIAQDPKSVKDTATEGESKSSSTKPSNLQKLHKASSITKTHEVLQSNLSKTKPSLKQNNLPHVSEIKPTRKPIGNSTKPVQVHIIEPPPQKPSETQAHTPPPTPPRRRPSQLVALLDDFDATLSLNKTANKIPRALLGEGRYKNLISDYPLSIKTFLKGETEITDLSDLYSGRSSFLSLKRIPATQPAELEKPTKEDFQFMATISCGAYGVVTKEQHLKTGQIFAMKTLIWNPEMENELEIEKEIMACGNLCESIVPLTYSIRYTKRIHFVMPLMEGNLLEFMDRLTVDHAFLYALELAEAIQTLHEMGIAHRDIKPSNILLDSNFHLKLTDFGTAVKLQEGELEYFPSQVGTWMYWAPENYRQEWSLSSDWWAYGCVLFEMFSLQIPNRVYIGQDLYQQLKYADGFVMNEDVYQKKRIMARIERLEGLDISVKEELEEVFQRCFNTEPGKRFVFSKREKKLEKTLFGIMLSKCRSIPVGEFVEAPKNSQARVDAINAKLIPLQKKHEQKNKAIDKGKAGQNLFMDMHYFNMDDPKCYASVSILNDYISKTKDCNFTK